MNIGFITAKGGQGATVTAATFALLCAEHRDTVLVTSDDGFRTLGLPVINDRMQVSGFLTVTRTPGELRDPSTVYVYDGTPTDITYLVTRACYLALAAYVTNPNPEVTGVVLVEESGRALTATDVGLAVGAPVAARIPFDPAISRAVDSGLLASRIPSVLRSAVLDLLTTEVDA